MKRKLEYLTDVSKLNNKEMNEKEMYKIRYQFISSPHIKEIILAMNPKVYDENKPEYANAILFFRSISANVDEMARLQKQLNTYERIEMTEINDKYKSPYEDHEWQEGYNVWERGFDNGSEYMLKKAIKWLNENAQNYYEDSSMHDNCWYDDEAMIEDFQKAMEEK